MIKFKLKDMEKTINNVQNALATLCNVEKNLCHHTKLLENMQIRCDFLNLLEKTNEKLTDLKEEEDRDKVLNEELTIDRPKITYENYRYALIQPIGLEMLSFMIEPIKPKLELVKEEENK